MSTNTRMSPGYFVTLAVVCVMASPAWRIAVAQEEVRNLAVDDPRPVAEAVASLSRSYPTVITYEDPPYQYSGDTIDVTRKVRGTNNPENGFRVLVPKGGRLAIDYQLSLATGMPSDVGRTLETLVSANNANSSGGRFRIEQSGDAYHVIPTEVRDANGRWIPYRSLLDTPVTLLAEGNGLELVDAVLKQVNATRRTRGGLSPDGYTGYFYRYRGAIDVRDEPARDVLLRVLHEIGPRLTWLMFYDPFGQYYLFNIASAAEPPPAEIPLDLSVLPGPNDPRPNAPLPRKPPAGN